MLVDDLCRVFVPLHGSDHEDVRQVAEHSGNREFRKKPDADLPDSVSSGHGLLGDQKQTAGVQFHGKLSQVPPEQHDSRGVSL